jgi:hypothetical protein
VLPKPVDKAIKRLREAGLSNFELIWRTSDAQRYHNVEEIQVIANYFRNKKNYDDLLEALVNGYEVEQTPEEQIKGLWTIMKLSGSDESLIQAYYQGMVQTLKVLNVKVSGVNH